MGGQRDQEEQGGPGSVPCAWRDLLTPPPHHAVICSVGTASIPGGILTQVAVAAMQILSARCVVAYSNEKQSELFMDFISVTVAAVNPSPSPSSASLLSHVIESESVTD